MTTQPPFLSDQRGCRCLRSLKNWNGPKLPVLLSCLPRPKATATHMCAEENHEVWISFVIQNKIKSKPSWHKCQNNSKCKSKRFGFVLHFFLFGSPQTALKDPSLFFHLRVTLESESFSNVASAFLSSSVVISK